MLRLVQMWRKIDCILSFLRYNSNTYSPPSADVADGHPNGGFQGWWVVGVVTMKGQWTLHRIKARPPPMFNPVMAAAAIYISQQLPLTKNVQSLRITPVEHNNWVAVPVYPRQVCKRGRYYNTNSQASTSIYSDIDWANSITEYLLKLG